MARRWRESPLLPALSLALLVACKPQGQPANGPTSVTIPPSPPSSAPPTVAIDPAAECASAKRAFAEALAAAPDAALRVDASYDALMAHNARLARSGKELVELRDGLTGSRLAARTNDFAQATHYLAYLTASLAGARQHPAVDLAFYEHALYIGTRQRELARRAALALCVDDGSRDQSASWQEQAAARLMELQAPLGLCMHLALADEPDHSITLHVKIHIGEDGRVVLAGPDVPFTLPGGPFTSELAYCVVREVEHVVFPRPEGRAIMVVPFVHEP